MTLSQRTTGSIEEEAATMLPAKKAVVVGGLGVIGRALVSYLDSQADWEIVALSRRVPDVRSSAKFVSVDLLNESSIERALPALDGVTHVFYAAYQERQALTEQIAPNLSMLQNAVEATERASPALAHVCLVQGGKAYGCHLGPYRTPARESDARHMPPNFYYNQEDYLRERCDAAWTWSAVRPEAVCGFAVGNPMNLLMVIGVYAAVCGELGLPFRFPGKPGAYRALYQVTDASVLADSMIWAATTPIAAGEVFNITNGDLFRWETLWPRLADAFGLAYAAPQTISLVEFMADKAPIWDRVIARYGLTPLAFEQAAAWAFGDFVFGCEYDVVSDVGKARRAGFDRMVIDTETMFLNHFERLRADRVLPPCLRSHQTASFRPVTAFDKSGCSSTSALSGTPSGSKTRPLFATGTASS